MSSESRTSPPPSGAKHNAPGQPSYSPEADVHILDRIAVLYRYRRIAIAVFVLTSAAMMIQGYSSIQMFRAQGRLLIENERSTAVPGIAGQNADFYEDPEPYFQTQFKILRGRDLTRRVIKKIRLQSLPADDQDCVIEFLKTLQVLPPGTKDLMVDENFCARPWPPR